MSAKQRMEQTIKHPVLLYDGRTVVYISYKSREWEIRLRYALRK